MEEWRKIDGYDAYEVSNLGRVRSHHRHGRRSKDGVHRPSKIHGYPAVALSNGTSIRTIMVHTLVARAFLGEPTCSDPTVNHIDFDRSNNCVTNLEWLSRGDNARHGQVRYVHPRGEKWHSAKLTEDDVRRIRESSLFGAKGKDLARIYGVTPQAICNIVKRRVWEHVDP